MLATRTNTVLVAATSPQLFFLQCVNMNSLIVPPLQKYWHQLSEAPSLNFEVLITSTSSICLPSLNVFLLFKIFQHLLNQFSTLIFFLKELVHYYYSYWYTRTLKINDSVNHSVLTKYCLIKKFWNTCIKYYCKNSSFHVYVILF